MATAEVTQELRTLIDWLQPRTRPWRAMTIAVDGYDHSGKSTLSRYLAWQLGMPTIEADLAFIEGPRAVNHDVDLIRRLVGARHNLDRPGFIEDVFVLQLLADLEIDPDIVVRSEFKVRVSGSWPKEFADYEVQYLKVTKPDYPYAW